MELSRVWALPFSKCCHYYNCSSFIVTLSVGPLLPAPDIAVSKTHKAVGLREARQAGWITQQLLPEQRHKHWGGELAWPYLQGQ